MRKVLSPLIIVLIIHLGLGEIVFAEQQGGEVGWQAALKQAVQEGGLEEAMTNALFACVPPSEVVNAAIGYGNDPYQVVKIGSDPELCPGGCVCGVVRGAVEAGAQPAVISKAAVDAGADAAVVERGLVASEIDPIAWRNGLRQALETGNLGQAVADPVLACVPPGEVVKAAVEIGHKPYLVIRAAIHAAGGGCLCEVLATANEIGVPCPVVARAAYDACFCPPEQAGLGYTPYEGDDDDFGDDDDDDFVSPYAPNQ